MIEKYISVNYSNPENTFSVIRQDGLSKTAGETSKEISDFIANLKIEPDKYVYVLINAMGAEEIYGDNNNHDSFPEYYEGKPNLIHDGTDYGYKTFQTNAHLFKHHRNKDPRKKYGDVLLSVYNHKMHRPELIVRIDRRLAPEEASKVDDGKVLATSMGAKVPFDVCSICGHKSKTRKEYCIHLKTMMGKILPDGRKVFAINPRPKFFDISMVFIPADSTSRVMKKLASLKSGNSSIEGPTRIKSAAQKIAEIEKYIQGSKVVRKGMDNIVESLIGRKMDAVSGREIDMAPERLNSIAASAPLPKILSTMAFSGIIPKPHEFQRIVLTRMGKSSFADMLDKNNIIFDRHTANEDSDMCSAANVIHSNVDSNIYKGLSDIMPYRSCMQPFMVNRISHPGMMLGRCVSRSPMNLNPIMAMIAGMYNRFMDSAPRNIYSTMARLLMGSNMIPAMGKKIIVIRSSFPGHLNTPNGPGEFMSNIISSRFGSNIVDSEPLDRVKYFLGNIFGVNKPRMISIMFKRNMMGTPMLRYISSGGPSFVKVSNLIDPESKTAGRRWFIDTLTGAKKRGFYKLASTVDSCVDHNMYDVITLAELGKLS